MATRKDNIKSLFTNTRTRVIILFTVVLMIIAVIIGVIKFKSSTNVGPTAEASLSNAPGISSIPGALNPTAQYAKLQEEQNLDQAQIASKTGGSAIPTIIKTQALGEGVQLVGTQVQGGVGFVGLSQEELGGQQSLWAEALQNANCSKAAMQSVINQGATIKDLKTTCNCIQLKANDYALKQMQQVCSCPELKSAGYNALQLKDAGLTADQLRVCGFDACQLRSAGFTAMQLKNGGFSGGELKGAGYSQQEINQASGLPNGISAADVRNAGCSVDALIKLRNAGVSASAIRQVNGCSAAQLKAAGFTAEDLKNAGYTAAELKNAGFNPQQLKAAGYSAKDLLNAGFNPDALAQAGFAADQIKAAQDQIDDPRAILAAAGVTDCSVASMKKAHAAGISALMIRQTLGCTAAQMKAGGYTAKELADAGFTAAELKAAGFSAAELKAAGFSGKELKDAGFSAKDLKGAGFDAASLQNAGFSAADLKNAGFNDDDIKNAGYSENQLKQAGIILPTSAVAGLQTPQQPTAQSQLAQLPQVTQQPLAGQASQANAGNQQLQAILNRQNEQFAEQRYQQKIQQLSGTMLGSANQQISEWKKVSTQVYNQTSEKTDQMGGQQGGPFAGQGGAGNSLNKQDVLNPMQSQQQAVIKAGDILYAVMDTSVNSDEPGPILATIVAGKLKGSKLIGSFNVPGKADKMVISFNTLSVPGAAKTISVSAYAIDPNTARTAMASRADHHYLLRYGSLFASSFLEGFGNAFQSANTTVTIGGTGGGNTVTVSNGVGRSAMENAIIGLATLGKTWGQQAQQLFNTPTTIMVYSGTGIGVLFTQDLTSL